MAKRVLLIEDNPTDAAIVKEHLIEEGIEVDVAQTGKSGLEKTRETKPDLVILDILLPDMSGFEVCSKLKKEISLKKTIIVILSVKDSIDDIKKGFAAEADDYIIKPPEPHFLVRKIKLYLGMR